MLGQPPARRPFQETLSNLVLINIISATLVVSGVMPSSTTESGPLERRSETVFLAAGVILLGYAVSKGVYTVTDVTAIGAFDVAFGGTGLLVAMLGLLSLYQPLRDSAPRLSLAGVVVTVIGTVATLAILGWLASATLLSAGYPAIPEEQPAWAIPALATAFITISLGFFAFGTASLRTDVLSKPVGRLLLVPGLAWLGLLVANIVLPAHLVGQYLGILAYVPISFALLAIGYLLRTEAARTDHMESTPRQGGVT